MDRSAAYAARWIAKSLVKANLCRRCLVQISYAIGVAKPLSILVFNYGTSLVGEQDLLKVINDNFDLRPGAIIKCVMLLYIRLVNFTLNTILMLFFAQGAQPKAADLSAHGRKWPFRTSGLSVGAAEDAEN